MATPAALIRRWYDEVWNTRLEKTIDELMARDIEGYMEGQEVRSPEDFKRARTALLEAFPDLAMTVEDVVAQDEKVVVRWRVSATHRGTFAGIPPTHRKIAIRGISWLEFRNGQIARGWDSWNLGGLLQSLK